MFLSLRRFFASRPSRSSRFNSVNENDVAALQRIVGAAHVLQAAADTAAYRVDWMNKYRADQTHNSTVVVRPKNSDDVAAVLRHCNARRLAVVPQAGNTGLVGGSVPVHDEIVLSTSRMREIERFDSAAGIVVCEAGVVLEQLDQYLRQRGFTVPLDLGAKGSCQVGGNVSTNAGGIRFLRYGSLHGSVSGVEVALANGELLDLLSTCRKDNTGYDLKQLFIGAEGTLGVVTKVALVAPPLPKATHVALFALESFEHVLALLRAARAQLGEVLSAFEHFDHNARGFVERHEIASAPLGDAPHYVLIETAGSNEEHDMAKLDSFLAAAFDGEQALVRDGVLAQSEAQAQNMWALRETIAEGLTRTGPVYKYDLSLPTKEFYECVRVMKQRFAHMPEVTVCGYGHVGDGNLHLNISVPEFHEKYEKLIEPFVYAYIRDLRGSISAEHGIGVMKPRYVHYSKPPAAIALMQQIKHVFDPNQILNPYKVLEMPPSNKQNE